MSKYIDKDELWERLRKRMVHHVVTNTLFNTIKAVINGMPTIEVSEDCIDRKKFIEVLDATANIWVEQGNDIMANGILTARLIANDTPSVVPKLDK